LFKERLSCIPRHEQSLLEALQQIAREDPSASITVIARSPEAARVHARTLRHGTAARLALDGAFEFRPGLTITCVPEVKGLEFDYVIVPDANASAYPALEEARRALYVAVTRATHRLVLATSGSWSPLLHGRDANRPCPPAPGGWPPDPPPLR